MGYYTRYELAIDVPDVDAPRPVDADTLRQKLYQKTGYSLTDECKWYDHEEHMREFSKEYPHVLFTLDGDGEENGDIWRKYFKNGKMQFEKQAKWEPPPFDPSKLK